MFLMMTTYVIYRTIYSRFFKNIVDPKYNTMTMEKNMIETNIKAKIQKN